MLSIRVSIIFKRTFVRQATAQHYVSLKYHHFTLIAFLYFELWIHLIGITIASRNSILKIVHDLYNQYHDILWTEGVYNLYLIYTATIMNRHREVQ